MKSTKIIGAIGASAALLVGAGVQMASAASPSCAVLDDPIHQVVNPKVGSSLLTPWEGEATKARTAAALGQLITTQTAAQNPKHFKKRTWTLP